MLKELLNIDADLSEIMFKVIIILGVIITIKLVKIIIRSVSFRRTQKEPVYKNLIKKTE